MTSDPQLALIEVTAERDAAIPARAKQRAAAPPGSRRVWQTDRANDGACLQDRQPHTPAAALRAQLERDGLPSATRWLQRKVWRQAQALDALNRRVLSQRLVLRALDELGRSLTAQEWADAKARIPNAQTRARVEA